MRPHPAQHGPARRWRAAVDAVETPRQHAIASPEPLIRDPWRLPPHFRVTVVGDIRVDVRTTLREGRFTDMAQDHYEQASVKTLVGGTAVNFARSAVDHFEEVRVVATIGSDAWAPRIRATLERLGCRAFLHDVARPNSPVVVVRDKGDRRHTDGTRLMVAAEDSTHSHLGPAVVEAASEHILAADALVLDTYALLAPASTAGLRAAVDLADAAGIPIALDLVPHRIDELLGLGEMRDLLRRASLVIVEAPTLLRLLGRPVPEHITADDAAGLVASLPSDLSGPTRSWFVRFGVGLADETVAMSTGHHRVHYRTGYAEAPEIAGYGYRIAAAELKWWLTNLARATIAYPGVDLGRRLRRPVS